MIPRLPCVCALRTTTGVVVSIGPIAVGRSTAAVIR